MKVAVKIRLKKSILDPQGKAVHHALQNLGFDGINDVRVGKLIELEVPDDGTPETIHTMVEEASRKLLANTVIEDFEIEYLGENA